MTTTIPDSVARRMRAERALGDALAQIAKRHGVTSALVVRALCRDAIRRSPAPLRWTRPTPGPRAS